MLKIRTLDAKALGQNLTLAEILEGWIEALRDEALQRLQRGEPVDGYKLVDKRAIRKWTDEYASKQACVAAAEAGVNLMEVSVISPAQAERKAKGVDFSPYWTKQSSGPTLAPEGDPRPAVAPTYSTLLEDLKGSIQ